MDLERGSPLWWLDLLGKELTNRQPRANLFGRYYEGKHPAPEHVRKIRLETEYRVLMDQAVTNWPALIIDSRLERMEIQGFNFGSKEANAAAWAIWQDNAMDADSGLLFQAALTAGRSYAIVWADDDGDPLIQPEDASTTIVAYREGSRRQRVAALRRWQDEDETWFATVYLPDGLYKYEAPKGTAVPDISTWTERAIPDETWPLGNPLGEVPVVEFAVNRLLKPGRFGSGRSELDGVLSIVDRINTTVFSGLLAQAYASFPVRALIGDPIVYEKDEQGNDTNVARPPFKVAVDRLIQIENPEGKLVQLPESSADNYIKSAEAHLRHLAAITKTPAYYILGELANLSADAIRASEAGLVSATRGHMRTLDDPAEDTMRLCFNVIDDQQNANNTAAATIWRNPEVRSDAQLADAALKLKDILPWQMLMEYLGYSPQEITKAEALRATTLFEGALAAQPGTPTSTPPIAA